ncbi:MAG: hypothetical protein COS14_11615 [Bacteroidetes bacterium CG02_land_8_20_14_3_00_31_25]|nr:PorT family protein [Bacteroidota bacterium]PIV58050.1 MAG: hypothetical protein COS14_11615 [Bacteroidetes bacterium CG02_land_8_20_14_3_00_31_25]PIY07025.1 MAG: hypothetical protein COZ21_01960 [Bacteroidetes bacterium CG_4_10_14_3_um_filter_31_20]
MFKYLKFILILFISIGLNAQSVRPLNLPKYDQMPLHFGMSLGLNQMDFTIHNSGRFLTPAIDSIYSIENTPLVGININIVSNFNFHNYYAVRFLPGLNFGQRNLTYWIIDTTQKVYYSHIMKIESTYLDLPLLFEYKGKRLTNFRPYLVGGASFKIDLAAQKKIKEEDKPKIRLSRTSFYYEVGFGTDFFLEYFKFALELKYVVGINNVLVFDNTQFSEAIERMNSKMLMFSITFEGSDIRIFKFGKRRSG